MYDRKQRGSTLIICHAGDVERALELKHQRDVPTTAKLSDDCFAVSYTSRTKGDRSDASECVEINISLNTTFVVP
jgi:hypothetical protein